MRHPLHWLIWPLLSEAFSGKLHCGVGTNTFADCPQCLESAMNSGVIDFWWNWGYATKVDMSHLHPEVAAKAKRSFTPMIWGTKVPKNFNFFNLGSEYVMGYNEPDQYGPACAGESSIGTFGCGEDEYRPATSAGFAELFDPAKAAQEWQKLVNFLAKVPRVAGASLTRLAAPSMAQAASPVDDCHRDPAAPLNLKFCRGWLQSFKAKTLTLNCTSLTGQRSNCWDVIEALPIHAYARNAQEIKEKLQQYHEVFREDFEGRNGRRPKKLWLTEVTMGSNEAQELVSFVEELMNPENGLQNREIFGFVDRISWFSEWSMGAFQLSSYTPQQDEAWSSSLFEPTTGHFTPHGARFIHHCGGGTLAKQPVAAPKALPPLPAPQAAAVAPPAPSSLSGSGACSIGAAVSCPNGGSCQGNQCCPDGSTCPSADASFKGCGDVKTEDCTKVSEPMRLLLLSAISPMMRF
mmetsp:Transcript_63871/g.101514  ORF Transcript_63871/g.101514 Transcript_63871/m.101514 type:complete len:463 (+) Transcript_63871:87-1475(+)